MKKILTDTTEQKSGQCDGCVFYVCPDKCGSLVCKRLYNKALQCKNKIYTFIEQDTYNKSKVSKKSNQLKKLKK